MVDPKTDKTPYQRYLEIAAERPDLTPVSEEEFSRLEVLWKGLNMMTQGQLAEEVDLIKKSHKEDDPEIPE